MDIKQFEPLVPVLVNNAALSQEDAANLFNRLNQGYEGSVAKLDSITEVTEENYQEVIEQLSTIKKYHDKIKALRAPVTQMLDDMKKRLMTFERPSDYSDKDSLYSQKRKLVEQFDEQKLAKAKAAQAKAEQQKKATVYLVELKTTIHRALLEMIMGKKKVLISKMAQWEASLTLATIDGADALLTRQKPNLKQEDWAACFHLNFKKQNIISAERDEQIVNEAIAKGLDDAGTVKLLNEENDKLHLQFMEDLKKEFTYEKYNEEYQQAVAPVINDVRARLPEIKVSLQNKDQEAKRQEEIKKREAEQQQNLVVEQQSRVEEVTHQHDMAQMEAEFTQQAQTQDIDKPNTVKIARFENDKMFLKPLLEVISMVAALPEFPSIVKKDAYIPGVKFWMDLYEKKCIDRPVKGIKITEKAKTTIKAE